NHILNYFHTERFFYTFRPTPLQTNTIDQFLFATRNGFCVHYAGAFVFLLRSAGIPARMVGGYQGGEIHESGRYISVHQYDAHAWAEVWLKGKGWVRFDPTASVAPARILDGAEGLLGDESFLADSPLSAGKLRNWPLLSNLRNSLEHLDYLWTKWVIGYNATTQYQFLGRFLGAVTPEKIAYALAGLGGGCVLVFALLLVWERPRRGLDPVDKLYLKHCKYLEKKGIKRHVGEAPYDFARRVSKEHPAIASQVIRIAALYVKIKYSKGQIDTEINKNAPLNHARLGPLYYQLKQQIMALRV
ncbi:MAG: transglutaminase, partial [Gammaproteobacteria bacterium]